MEIAFFYMFLYFFFLIEMSLIYDNCRKQTLKNNKISGCFIFQG